MYQIGQVVNGHMFNGADWIPQAAPAAPPAPPAPPPPNPHSMGQGIPPAPPAPPSAPVGYAPPPAPPSPMHAPAAAIVSAPATYAGGSGQPGRMKTGRVRLSYLFCPQRDPKGKQRVALLFPKQPGVYEQLAAKRDEAIRAKVKGDMPQYYRDPIKDGDTYKSPTNGKPLGEECRGHWVINAVGNATSNVEMFDQYGFAITAPGAVKSGDWGRASITFYYSDKDNNLGVNVALNSIIFTDKGEPLSSSGISAEDEFAGDFQQAPQGYVPPGHGYQAPQLSAPPGYQPGQQAQGGFAPPPGAPQQQAARPVESMVWDPQHNAYVPNPALGGQQQQPQYAPPPAPPAPPPVPVTPPGPPPGAAMSPDGKYWWNAGTNAWVSL